MNYQRVRMTAELNKRIKEKFSEKKDVIAKLKGKERADYEQKLINEVKKSMEKKSEPEKKPAQEPEKVKGK